MATREETEREHAQRIDSSGTANRYLQEDTYPAPTLAGKVRQMLTMTTRQNPRAAGEVVARIREMDDALATRVWRCFGMVAMGMDPGDVQKISDEVAALEAAAK